MRIRKMVTLDSNVEGFANPKDVQEYMDQRELKILSAALKTLMEEHQQLSQQVTQQQHLVNEIVQGIVAQLKPAEKKVTMTDRNVMVLLKLFDGVVVQNGWDNSPIPDDTMKPTTVARQIVSDQIKTDDIHRQTNQAHHRGGANA
ncbi:hypothetical protein M5119_12580 [Lacticaseibacillus paracasei]|nr:hypothetical protein [Lacticaseibacillus paracasei]MBU6045730.1 hypothetical protein [Lacticaseibacillus paracasei]MCL4970558.1 hypothetical protein [Lacticaseibacillus paracasei]OJF73186.1 hypothetical protein BOQ55_12670 [Lacticaseibacillus casei]